MIRKFTLIALGGVLLLTSIVSIASAGGWAVVTLDAVPTDVTVFQPVTIGMRIRQHGQTDWVYDNVRVRGFHSTGETFTVVAKMDTRGHYTAELVFNKPGKWEWAVASGLMPEWQTMPGIEVLDTAQLESMMAKNTGMTTTATSPATGSAFLSMMPSMTLLGIGVLGFVLSGAGLLMWWRRRI